MRKTKMEVKTIYNIEFDLTDFTKIFMEAKDDVTRINAFSKFNLEDDTMGNVKSCFNEICKLLGNNAEDIRYIVRKLGFDGVENYGYYEERTKTYKLVVFNHGDDMNKGISFEDAEKELQEIKELL